jgi:cellulose biosynthesis protein BcsQ
MTKTVLFATNKGGVGKSTLSTNFAAVYARLNPGKKVLYVDLTMTRSISGVLLGSAPVKSMSSLLDALSKVRTMREKATYASWCVTPVVLALVGMLTSKANVIILTLFLYVSLMYVAFSKRTSKKVNPMSYGSESTLYTNLTVLVGGETLANMPSAFPFKTATKEWRVPSDVDLVLIDLDNCLNDDYSRWALSIADEVVVPMSLSAFDFERLTVDPRNGALFNVLKTMGSRAPRVSAVVFNRLRVQAHESGGDAEFKISGDDQSVLNLLQDKIRVLVGDKHQITLMREMPSSIMSAMLSDGVPIDKVKKSKSNSAALDNAIENIEKIVQHIF